jgi:hypothetical protein
MLTTHPPGGPERRDRSRVLGPRVFVWVLAAVVLVVLLVACDLSRMNFVQDDRLEITSPDDRTTVDFPVTVSWTVEDFGLASPDDVPSEDAGYFAVFLDRSPIGPGDSIFDIGEDDPACRADPDCPDRAYLNQNDIYPTRTTQVRLDAFPILGVDQEYHTVWVVLLDNDGRRIGESQWKVTFDVRLPGEEDS